MLGVEVVCVLGVVGCHGCVEDVEEGGGGTQGKGDLFRRNPAAAVEASAVRANVSELSPMP